MRPPLPEAGLAPGKSAYDIGHEAERSLQFGEEFLEGFRTVLAFGNGEITDEEDPASTSSPGFHMVLGAFALLRGKVTTASATSASRPKKKWSAPGMSANTFGSGQRAIRSWSTGTGQT